MMRNDSPDPEMERRLRDHFAAEAEDLQAPDDLWDRLEGQLGEQRPPRFTLLRGGAMTLRNRPWLSAAAAAVLVVAIGIATVGRPAGDPTFDDVERDAFAVTTSQSRDATTTASSSTASTTTTTTTSSSAASTAADDSASINATSESESSTITADAPPVSDDDAAPATASDAAPEPTATQAPARASTPTPATVAPAPPAATTPTPEPTPAQTVAAAPTPPAGQVPSPRGDTGGVVEEPVADAAMDDAADMADGAPPDDSDASMDAEDSMDDGMADADDSMPAEEEAAEDAIGEAEAEAEEQEPEDTTFQNYERTPFIDTSIDAVSTFSLDADRTSYFLALNWARNGYRVAPASVRAEEWINAFDYGYDAPTDDRSFAITSDVLRHPLDDGRHLARVAFQAPELDDSTPLNVTLVLDASGSMNRGNRVAIAREAAETIRQSLGADDRIAVVHFTTDVLDAYTVEHSAPDDGDVVTSISALAPHGTTNVQAGLNLGVQLADQARRERPDAFNYVILMSDGVTNVDATDPFTILESAADTDARNPLRLITIGVGIENYNDVLLEQLAQHGNGWYRYLDDTTQARATFARENWLALSTPFADQTRAQVTWDPAIVKSWRIVGYENRITPDHTFEQNRREFAELYSGAATTVFYELELQAGYQPSGTLGRVEVRWVEPATGESRSQSADVAGRFDLTFDCCEHLIRLGAIVGLAADRYSSLSTQVEGQPVDAAGVRDDLAALQDELDAISGRFGSAEAYTDFNFLLGWITAAADALVPASGYSR